ncbi:hypothetical protein MLD52_23020, partial [Puniceicoccaceae bacterium K14]|nr:hypothetical protein [Puniceicoccaceae bacterium K14]
MTSTLLLLSALLLAVSEIDLETHSTTHDTSAYSCRVLVPRDIQPNESLPLLLFLHGLGEKGKDNKSQVTPYLSPLIEATQSPDTTYRAILVAPQSSSGWWQGEQVNQLVDDMESLYPIDISREYLIGISAGGGGCYVTLA